LQTKCIFYIDTRRMNEMCCAADWFGNPIRKLIVGERLRAQTVNFLHPVSTGSDVRDTSGTAKTGQYDKETIFVCWRDRRWFMVRRRFDYNAGLSGTDRQTYRDWCRGRAVQANSLVLDWRQGWVAMTTYQLSHWT